MIDRNVEVSVVVPLYNEEDSAVPLYKAIKESLEILGLEYEILFVNDGSSDSTFEIASKLAADDQCLRVIEFRKNYGQTPAMAAGIETAQGNVIVTMDGDLQNDPSDIPMMVNKLKEGYDIVVGWRHNRQDELLKRKIPSIIANRLIGMVTGVPIKDNGCSLKVYRAAVIKKMPFYSEMHRFIPAILSLSGAKCAEVKVKHHARQFGESKYGLSRIYKVLIDLLTIKTILSMTSHPIMWFFKLSLVPFIISFICIVFLFLQFAVGGPTIVVSTVVLLMFCLGVFLVNLGLLCELIYQKSPMRISEFALLTANTKESETKETGMLECPINCPEKN